MGLIDRLLTGGVLIGKICQSLSSSQQAEYSNQEAGMRLYEGVSLGGVTFFRRTSATADQIYAYNSNTDFYASVVVPNENDQGGVLYIIRPTEKVTFGEASSSNVSPDTNVTTGITNSPYSDNSELGADPPSLLKLSFKDLKIGSWLNIGSFKFSCTTTQLVIVTAGATISAISYLLLRSNKGVSASSQSKIKPDQTGSSTSEGQEITYAFTVNFSELGFDINKDTFEGQITCELPLSPEQLVSLSKVESTSLESSEVAFFSR